MEKSLDRYRGGMFAQARQKRTSVLIQLAFSHERPALSIPASWMEHAELPRERPLKEPHGDY